MTRDEHRTKCIKAIAMRLGDLNDCPWKMFIADATAAFDSIPTDSARVWFELTKQPEEKP
jgi:hypothetical protein